MFRADHRGKGWIWKGQVRGPFGFGRRWRGESQGKEESEGGAEKGEAEKVRSHF